MSEADAMPSLMMMTSIVSEESLARDRQTDTHRDLGSSTLVKVALQTKKNIKIKAKKLQACMSNVNSHHTVIIPTKQIMNS